MSRAGRRVAAAMFFVTAMCGVRAGAGEADPYEQYVKSSEDFKAVRQDAAWCEAAFPSWTYMPWTYQWTMGYDAASGQWAVAHGYNGAFVNRLDIEANGQPRGRLDWIEQFKLRFYTDHSAGKGDLHLWDGNQMAPHANEVHGNGIRTRPLNQKMFQSLQRNLRETIGTIKSSPQRAAYALDDEVSWGHFVHPCMWCVTDEPGAFQKWLNEIYGKSAAPRRDRWITYDDIQPKLKDWSVGEFDASPLMDQWTFNDSYWNNFVGRLVEYANALDPHTPCGFVGGQCPDAFGGYDYAKVMRKVQFIESYNIGSSQAIIRSFNPANAIPSVTTHFHQSSEDDIWQTWYYLAHGNRGMIGWVDGWFDGNQPKSWHDQVAPTYREAAEKIGPLMSGAQWVSDGIAIYYSHPSIQLGWVMDAQPHGKTWRNRNGDERLGASFMVRHAWENMLRDAGLQYDFISYAQVIEHGVPEQYRVLILPACLCLSDAEARQIEAFCRRGGTVIADYMPGLWDQHGKGCPRGGVLDAMFGVHHPASMRCNDVFNGTLWCEVDQDANFSWKSYQEFLTHENHCIKDPSGFNKAVRDLPTKGENHVGRGTAVLMNLSPQWYNAYRDAGAAEAKRAQTFLAPIEAAGVRPRCRVEGDAFGSEVTYWRKGDRTILFLCANPELVASQTGGGNAQRLSSDVVKLKLHFPRPLAAVRDERADAALPDGDRVDVDWKRNEAVVLSFKTPNNP